MADRQPDRGRGRALQRRAGTPGGDRFVGARWRVDPIDTSITTQSPEAWVVDVVTQGDDGIFTPTQSHQTMRWQAACGGSSLATSTKRVPAVGVSVSGWSHSAPKRYAHALAAFAPASAPPSTVAPTTTTLAATTTIVGPTTTLAPDCTTNSDCADGDACTADTCNAGACQYADVSAACNDGVFCNGAETCAAAAGCQPGTPPATSDGIACTVDACDEASDTITHTPSNAACDDGNACTSDVCNAASGCGHTNTCGPQPIALDASSVKGTCGATEADTIAITGVTVGSQPNRVLVVSVGAEDDNADCNMALADMIVTYGATRLTLAVSALSGTGGWRACNAIFYMLNPPTGTADVGATFPARVGLPIDARQVGAFVLYNVAQQAPQVAKAAGAQATTNPVNTSIATLSPEAWVVDVFTQGEPGTFTPTQSGQISRWVQSCGSASSVSSTKNVATPSATTLGWLRTNPKRYAHSLAAFAPAP